MAAYAADPVWFDDEMVALEELPISPRLRSTLRSWVQEWELILGPGPDSCCTPTAPASRDNQGRFFEVTAHAALLSHGSLEQALDHLVAALTRHLGHQLTDDVALVLAERRGHTG